MFDICISYLYHEVIGGKMSYDLMILSVGAKYKDNIFQSNIIAERLNGFGRSNKVSICRKN